MLCKLKAYQEFKLDQWSGSLIYRSILFPDDVRKKITEAHLRNLPKALLDYIQDMERRIEEKRAISIDLKWLEQARRWDRLQPLLIGAINQVRGHTSAVMKFLLYVEIERTSGKSYKLSLAETGFPHAGMIINEVIARAVASERSLLHWLNMLPRLARRANQLGRRSLSGLNASILKDGQYKVPVKRWVNAAQGGYQKKIIRETIPEEKTVRQWMHAIQGIFGKEQQIIEYCHKLETTDLSESAALIREIVFSFQEHTHFADSFQRLDEKLDVREITKILKMRAIEYYSQLPYMVRNRRIFANQLLKRIVECLFAEDFTTARSLAEGIASGYDDPVTLFDARDKNFALALQPLVSALQAPDAVEGILELLGKLKA